MVRALSIVIVAGVTGATLAAQGPTAASFDVASVKPARVEIPLRRPLGCAFGAGGRFNAYGWLRYLIACAYGIRTADLRQRIVGGPDWIDSDFFEIMAKSSPAQIPRAPDEALAMVRSLLAERFQLAVHRETREVSMYALIVARRDGRLGPQLRPAPADCAAWIAGGRRGAPPPIAGDRPCGRLGASASGFRSAAMSLSQLANLLSPRVERPVQDRTGLTGLFAVDLQWRPANQRETSPADPLPASVFTALQEQLGLKLESMRGPLEVLVIDHVEPPTPD